MNFTTEVAKDSVCEVLLNFLNEAGTFHPTNHKVRFSNWHDRVVFYLKENYSDNDIYAYFAKEAQIHSSMVFWEGMSKEDEIVGYELAKARKALRYLISNTEYDDSEKQKSTESMTNSSENRKVFVVHGHDELNLQKLINVLSQLEFEAVVIKEKANSGQTIIEKIEKHSDVGFCVVLMTDDDIGASKADHKLEKHDFRPRQNVLIEFGFFWGKLGRSRVCLLNSIGQNISSDLAGLGYTQLDKNEAWKFQLVKELKNAGYSVDANKIM